MLRRLALTASLAAALVVPSAGRAQVAGEVKVIPGTFGLASCTSPDLINMTWTTSAASFSTTDFYRVLVSNTSGCAASSGTIVTGTLADNLPATGLTQALPLVNSVNPSDFLALAGYGNCNAAVTVYVCVQQWPAGGGGSSATPLGTASTTVKVEVYPPPVPIISTVAPGDGALFVSWTNGTSTGVSAVTWDVTATPQAGSVGGATASFTTTINQRLGGLSNGNTYDVTVVAVSAGGNRSAASAPVAGTPQVVNGFWDIYKADNGREVGGCGGGPAGLVSLLGVALGLRLARRRP